MLNVFGDILNWIAAGVLFPLLFLPLGILASQKRPLIVWALIVLLVAAAGVAFARLTPILAITLSPEKLLWFAGLFAATILAIGASGFAKTTLGLSSMFDAVTRATGRGVMWLLLVMALLQFAVVVLRYVFGVNSIFMQESVTYMHGAVFLLAGGYALLTDDHVRVDILYREASPRRKAMIDLAGTYLFLVPVCLLLLWTASPYVARSWAVGEGSNDVSGIQAVFILKSFIPAFAVLMMMVGLVIASRACAILKGSR